MNPRNLNLICPAWENYVHTSMDAAKATWPQIRKTREAFYAGATAVYELLLVVENASKDEGHAILRTLALELKAWEESLKNPELRPPEVEP